MVGPLPLREGPHRPQETHVSYSAAARRIGKGASPCWQHVMRIPLPAPRTMAEDDTRGAGDVFYDATPSPDPGVAGRSRDENYPPKATVSWPLRLAASTTWQGNMYLREGFTLNRRRAHVCGIKTTTSLTKLGVEGRSRGANYSSHWRFLVRRCRRMVLRHRGGETCCRSTRILLVLFFWFLPKLRFVTSRTDTVETHEKPPRKPNLPALQPPCAH